MELQEMPTFATTRQKAIITSTVEYQESSFITTNVVTRRSPRESAIASARDSEKRPSSSTSPNTDELGTVLNDPGAASDVATYINIPRLTQSVRTSNIESSSSSDVVPQLSESGPLSNVDPCPSCKVSPCSSCKVAPYSSFNVAPYSSCNVAPCPSCNVAPCPSCNVAPNFNEPGPSSNVSTSSETTGPLPSIANVLPPIVEYAESSISSTSEPIYSEINDNVDNPQLQNQVSSESLNPIPDNVTEL